MGIQSRLLLLLLPFAFTSCERSSGSVWEDTKTVSRHLERKTRSLWGGEVESRAVSSRDEFNGPAEEEFIPLQAEDLSAVSHSTVAEEQIQPKDIVHVAKDLKKTGAFHIDMFRDPHGPLANVFTRLHFNTDDHVLRKKEYYEAVAKMAEYLRSHPSTYVFVIGHCDNRASEAYNLALGSRRANSIRSLLIKRGVNPERVYTLSMGKEMPLDSGNNPESWAKNRRVEFKLFSQQ